MINVEKFWKQVVPNRAPKHRGGKVVTSKPPIPKPKPIRKNKPGIYWYETGNAGFIVYPDLSVDVVFLSGLLDDAFYSPDNHNGFTRNSDADFYLGGL